MIDVKDKVELVKYFEKRISNKGLEMKYLIIFLVVISLPLFAQKEKNNNSKVDIKIQMTEWMAKISSDPELREAMIEMILDNTKGNVKEMTKFGRTIMDNPGMNSIIGDMVQAKSFDENISIQPQIVMGDTTKVMKLTVNRLSTQK